MRARFPLAGTRSVCAWLVALLALAAAQAVAAPSTYTGEAPVTSQSDEDRGEALKTALANVVFDVTGDTGALARSDVAAAVAKAERYMVQYRYRSNASAEPNAPRWVLVAEFDSAAVDDMLHKLGLLGGGTASVAPSDTPSEATVWISGIHSADDYARIVAYLAKNNFVKTAQPTRARGDGMLVRLALQTDLKRFLDVVGMERTLVVVNAAPPVDGVDATLAVGGP